MQTQAEWRAKFLTVTLENIPPDMGWMELKNLGRVYGYVAYARCYRNAEDVCCGILEYSRQEDRDCVVEALNGELLEGSRRRLRATPGAPPEGLASLPGGSDKARRTS